MERGRKLQLLRTCVAYLADERAQAGYGNVRLPGGEDVQEWWTLFRALANVREPQPATAGFYAAQDELLQGMIEEAGVQGPSAARRSPLDGRLSLWRGDITTFAADAIVNAANSQMLGCWRPGHHCIDNAIHTFAGVQLREECARIMAAQGHDEPTGAAKVTAAYNLPAKRVIHTVGPIAQGRASAEHELQLASCYESCLSAAQEHRCAHVAFCCISTGVFGFPQAPAAQVALGAVRRWLAEHPGGPQVVFCVFTDEDERIYRKLLAL